MSNSRPTSRRSNTLNSTTTNNTRIAEDGITTARQRQSKKDEAIRKKAENDLKKKKSQGTSSSEKKRGRRVPGTVAALRPSPALTVNSSIKVTDASRMMAAKRADCVLVVDEDDHLAGIFTAKDLAYRVAAEGLDARSTTVESIMTPNPLCVTSDASATDALNTMVQRGFRHLPVCNDEGDVVGLLDITKCLYDALDKMDRAYGSSRKLYDALEGVEKEWASQAPQLAQLMDSLKTQINCPDVTTVFDGSQPAEISPKATVREAARIMKSNRTTAVLVMENENIGGIFTSKDVVLRVIAAQLDPANCSVVRVMTPHPDTAPPETTILDALKRMHHGHYLNLPIVNEFKQVIGMVDVLKLTYATLEQINSIQGQEGDGSGPMWSKFWGSAFAADETETMISDSHSHQAPTNAGSDVYPHESVSAVDEELNAFDDSPKSFVFKFKSTSGKVYRLHSASDDFFTLRENVVSKLLEESPSSDPESFPALCYTDEDGDQVQLLSDDDLSDAVLMARQNGWQRLILSLVVTENLPTQNLPDEVEVAQANPKPPSKAKTVETTILEPELPPVSQPETKAPEPLIPDNLIVPVAVGGGFLAALIAVVIVMKATSR